MTFKELLENAGLSKNTVKLYSIKLNQLDERFKLSPEVLTSDKSKIVKFINAIEKTDNKLAYYNAILKYLDLKKNDKSKNFYLEKRNELNKKKFKSYDNNLKGCNFVDYDILLAGSTPILDSTTREMLESFLLFMSIRYPLRLSLWNIRLAKSKDGLDDTKNYFLIKKNGYSFIMNDFKNVKSFGKYEFDVDKEDIPAIKMYLKRLFKMKTNPEFLLYNYYNLESIPFGSSDVYSRKLKKILKERFDKDLTINDIRRSYESHLIQSKRYKNMTNEEQKKEHAKLLHSASVARNCYNKV